VSIELITEVKQKKLTVTPQWNKSEGPTTHPSQSVIKATKVMRIAMRNSLLIFFFMVSWIILPNCSKVSPDYVEISAEQVEDKIRGGLLGQLLGNLNGLRHEMRYIDEPGAVENYIPSLPKGAWSDDDTDIEWIYIVGMQKSDTIFLAPEQISDLWRSHINERIWCSNLYARNLMNLGINPPLTGRIALNPWAIFNISGQFICESFGLIAPAMPQTAARIGLHYTHVTIDGEPAQTTQLFTTMIATAFVEDNIEKILQAGLAAIDKESEIHQIVTDVCRWWKQSPQDWRKTRATIKQKYSLHNGEMRDRNGYELNTASTVASLLYGGGDFSETLRHAFNFGWDADNNAATCGTIIGVIKGRKWMDAQGWAIKDVYKNVTRDGMPMDETITSFGDRLVAQAKKVILENGGKEIDNNGQRIFRIYSEDPANVEPLPRPINRLGELREQLIPLLEKDLSGLMIDRARAVYLAICLGEADRISSGKPIQWADALDDLKKFPQVIKNVFEAPEPAATRIKDLALASGLYYQE